MTEKTRIRALRWRSDTHQTYDYVGGAPPLRERLYRGEARADGWIPPRVFSPYRNLRPSDITKLDLGNAVVRASTAAALQPSLDETGELLPLIADEAEPLFLLNVTRVVDCYEARNSTLSFGGNHFAFHAERVPRSRLFKVPELADVMIFSAQTEGVESFRERVERLGLEGIAFDLVWQDGRPVQQRVVL